MSSKKTVKGDKKINKIVQSQEIDGPLDEVELLHKHQLQKKIKKEKQQLKSKANRLKEKAIRSCGIVYIGHLPYGFVEEGIQEYFTQFGEVQGVKLFRSTKTNRVQGFGFVKFEDRAVAEIAAKAMNGYLMNNKKIVAHVIGDQHPDPFKYRNGSKKLHFINWSQKFIEESNKEKTNEQIVKELNNLVKNEQLKRQALEEAGVQYTYTGFKELLNV